MANRRIHKIVGGMSGGAAAMVSASACGLPPVELLVEAVGGIVGGVIGGVLPDEFEPAIHSWHRSIVHSCSAACVGVATLPAAIALWQQHCRERAGHYDSLANASLTDADRVWHVIRAMLWRLFSGLLIGVFVGYASHLVLDAATPRSLPILF